MDGNGDARREFSTWDSYWRFARHVRSAGRYILGEEQREFLQTVLATIRDRDRELKAGQTLFRAQLGVDVEDRKDEDGNWIGEDTWGLSSSRMKPLTDRAKEGRANPIGISVLYAATTTITAISEVRPWVGADVSVATCRILRSLRVLDLSVGSGKSSFEGPVFRYVMGGTTLSAEDKERAVWIDIDNAFSEPVTPSDDRADYAPTQILAELFRSVGYDAIAYRSHFGAKDGSAGYNIAIFDPDNVELVTCAPYRVERVTVDAVESGNPWFSSKE